MKLFGCRGCEAHQSEIEHLLAEQARLLELVDRQSSRLCELTDRGAAARAVPPQRGSLAWAKAAAPPDAKPPSMGEVVEAAIKRKEAEPIPERERVTFPGYEERGRGVTHEVS